MAGRAQAAVQASSSFLIQRYLPWINGAVLAGCVVFSFPGQHYVIIGLALFLPFLDRFWHPPALPRSMPHYVSWAIMLLTITILLAFQPAHVVFALFTLFFTALPEEWFFRAYFMVRQGEGFRANAITSALFSLMHGLTRDWTTALLVLAPSLFYGWLYQRTRDLPLLVLVHTLSNLIFAIFLAESLVSWMSYLQ